VSRTFLDKERLVNIPNRRNKKRLYILFFFIHFLDSGFIFNSKKYFVITKRINQLQMTENGHRNVLH